MEPVSDKQAESPAEHQLKGDRAPLAIVTVTYSPGDHLRRFLDSLADATSRDFVVVMADNGSTDGAPEAAVEPNVELLRTGGNVGYGTAVNIAARLLARRRGHDNAVDSEFFVIVNPDVEFSPGSIDRMIEAAHRHPRAGAVGPKIVEPDGSVYPSAREVPEVISGIGHALLGPIWKNNPWSKKYRRGADLDREREAGWVSGSCLLVRWGAFESIGGFDERYFMYMEDVDLGDRMTHAGWQNIFTPEATVTHAQGHSANKHKSTMLPAHHDSAYRFQADRHPGLRWLPLRVALWCGLKARMGIFVALAGLDSHTKGHQS